MGIENFNFGNVDKQKNKGIDTAFNKKEEPVGFKRVREIIDLKNKGRKPKENLKANSESKGEAKGFKLEKAIVDWLQELPGVESAELSTPFQDVALGIDIVVRFKGDSEPVYLQITCDPKKTIDEAKPNTVFIKLSEVEATEAIGGNFTNEISNKIAKKIINFLKFNHPESFEALMNVRGI